MSLPAETANRPIIIRPRELRALLSVSRNALNRMVQGEGFPPPIQLGPRSVGYVKAEVEAWLEARKAARATEPAGE